MKRTLLAWLPVLGMVWVMGCSGEGQPPASAASSSQQAAAQPVVQPAAQPQDPFGMAVEQVADNVYAIISPARGFPDPENLGWNANAAFVVTAEGVLMFDTGSSERIGQALRAQVRSVTEQPVRWIVNTHSHGDHWLGNSAFLADQPEQILASDQAIALMQSQGAEWQARFNRLTDGAIGQFELVPARDAVTQSDSYFFSHDEAYILRAERAHSPGDLALWLPRQGVLLAADLVYTERGPATFDSDVQGWIAMLDQMLALQPRVVVPGHGPVAGIEAVQNMRDFFQTLWDIVEQGYEDGKMDFEIAATAREQMADFETIYPGMSDSLGEMVSHIYLQVEAALF